MSRQILHEVRDVLRAADAIASEREFCERWLGKSECYMRTLRFSQIEPSADALATVSNKLKYYAEQMHSKDTQLSWIDPFDSVKFLALAILLFDTIETKRIPKAENILRPAF